MTFEETETLLLDMQHAKRRANALLYRKEELERQRDSIQSALGGDGTRVTDFSSRVERLALRIELEREKYIEALEEFFELEDKVIAAIETLDPEEKEVITAFYLDGMPKWKVAQIAHCSESSVKRYKKRGVVKISKLL